MCDSFNHAIGFFLQYPGDDNILFEEAMQSGYVLCNLVILLLIGVAGSGKTCFSQLVLDMPPPAVRESTPLAQAAIRAVSTSRVSVSYKGTVWKTVSPTELLNMLADGIKGKAIFHFLTPLPTPPQISLPDRSEGAFTKLINMLRRPKEACNPQPENLLATKTRPSSEKLAKSSLVRNVISHMSKAEPTTNQVFSENWVYLTDSGGQPQFHELIPTFMHHVSGAALFVKLNEDLSSHPTIGYYAKGGKLCGTTYSSSLTHEQTIKNCLQMMQSRLNISGDNDCPALFFIGTHKDLESASSESIESKDGQILDILKSLKGLKEHVVFNRVAKPKRLMYVVNARNPDDEDHCTIAEFRQAVMKGCKKIELKIPLSWFILEQQLQELAQKKLQLVLSFEECLKVACDLEMDKARLLAALDYFVRLNLFKFFPKVLPDVVFTTSQVLLDKISELVAYSHYISGEPGTEPSSSAAQSENDINSLRFGDHAIVNATFLKRFDAHYRYTDNLFTPLELLDVLSNQLVFAPLTGEDFFMPCVLPQLSLEKVSSYRLPSSSPVAPVLIYYTGGLFSTGLFSALVAFLQDRSPWKVAEKHGEPICLFKNCVMFRHTDFPITLTLIYSFEFIEIHIQVRQGFSPEPYTCVRTTLLLGLDRAARIQGCNNLFPKIGFFCPCGNKSSHLATVSDDGKWWFCSIDDTCSGTLAEEHIIWLSDYCEGSSTTHGEYNHFSYLVLIDGHYILTYSVMQLRNQARRLLLAVVDRVMKIIKFQAVSLCKTDLHSSSYKC